MVQYTIEIEGVENPFYELTYVKAYTIEPHPFSVTIPNTGQAIPDEATVQIFRDGDLYYTGYATTIKAQEEGKLLIEGFDSFTYAKKLRAKNRLEASIPAGTQVRNQLEHTPITEGTIEAGPTCTMEYGGNEEDKFDKCKVWQELAFMSGYEVLLRPNNTLDFKTQCGVDRHTTIKFVWKETLDKWKEAPTRGTQWKVDRILVMGKGVGDFLTYGFYAKVGFVVGTDPERIINRKNLVTDETCESAATALYADSQLAVQWGTIKVTNTWHGAAFDIYDSVTVQDSTRGVNGTYRIIQIEASYNAIKGETMMVRYCNLAHITSSSEYLIDTGEGWINDTQRTSIAYSNTQQQSSNTTGITVPAAPNRIVNAKTGGGPWGISLPSNTWTNLLYPAPYYFTPPDDCDELFVTVQISNHNAATTSIVVRVRIYNETDGEYYPNDTGAYTRLHVWKEAGTTWMITIPRTLKNKQLKVQAYPEGVTVDVSAFVNIWAHSQHYHNPNDPSHLH